ncbi:MAG: ComEC/Rec2 family competence protein, partial [Opitutaceae bacterium]|nr:ComEC/Rec2 family competence protein [Opitutaceae bacterium]
MIEVSPSQLLIALLLISASLALSFSKHPLSGRLWNVSFTTALVLTAAVYFNDCDHHPKRWDRLPPREAILTIEINRLFQSSQNSAYTKALATIRNAPIHLADLIDQRIFVTFRSKKTTTLSKSTHLQLKGILERLSSEHSQQGFYRYLRNQGVSFTFTQGELVAIKKEISFLQRFYQAQSQNFSEILRTGLPPGDAHAATYTAMLLGNKSALTKEQKTTFIQSGTLHLFAVSGLHIGVIALCLYSLLSFLRLPSKIRAIIGLSLLYLFVSIIGSPPSAQRAFLMIAFFWVGFQLRRPTNPLASFSASALIVLLVNPWQLFDVSFQLSYTVVFSIILYGIPLAKKWSLKWKPFALLP